MRKGTWIVACVLLVCIALPALAQNQLAGLLRDELALGLTPTLKSAGMGGAYVGVDNPLSMNPASLSSVDFFQVMGTYGLYDSDDGPTAHRGRADFIYPVPYIGGNSRLMIDGLTSDGSDMSRLGAPLEYDGLTLGSQYGRNITDWFAVGFGGYPYEKASVDMHTPGGTVKSEALSQLGSIQLGALFRPHDKVRLGVEYIYIKDDLETWLPGPAHMGDYFYIHYVAVGISATPFDGTLVALDYWNGEIEGDVSPGVAFDVDVDRWNFGVQQRVCDFCDLRVGSNNGGFTTGFTIHIQENLDFDYAYINKALRDKENVLGDTQYHGVALTYRF
ncbi:MAG: hypothetical protein RBU29_14365 [bacterium]|nr:hypothetical protein [bacterium]